MSFPATPRPGRVPAARRRLYGSNFASGEANLLTDEDFPAITAPGIVRGGGTPRMRNTCPPSAGNLAQPRRNEGLPAVAICLFIRAPPPAPPPLRYLPGRLFAETKRRSFRDNGAEPTGARRKSARSFPDFSTGLSPPLSRARVEPEHLFVRRFFPPSPGRFSPLRAPVRPRYRFRLCFRVAVPPVVLDTTAADRGNRRVPARRSARTVLSSNESLLASGIGDSEGSFYS